MPRYLANPHLTSDETAATFGIELNQCPFCGHLPQLSAGYTPHVTCYECGADGPYVEGPSDTRFERCVKAILLWNKRV